MTADKRDDISAATIIKGREIAARLTEDIKIDTQDLIDRGITPGLAVILVGEDPASQVYVRHKIKACKNVGIKSIEHRLPEETPEEDLLALIQKLNNDDTVHGILPQLPLPHMIDEQNIINAIDPDKDVDGLNPLNLGRLMSDLPGLVPCTPQGALTLIKSVRKDLTALHAVILGRSLLFGKPMAQLLLKENCTVTQCHSRTVDVAGHCRQADILIAAVGSPHLVRGEWVKPGAIVIDVGINRLKGGTLTGDIEFEAVLEKAQAVTPVPGGVGPMTIAYLLKNTVQAAQKNSAG